MTTQNKNSKSNSKKNKIPFTEELCIHPSLIKSFIGSEKSNILEKMQKQYSCKIYLLQPSNMENNDQLWKFVVESRKRQNLKECYEQLKQRYQKIVSIIVKCQEQVSKEENEISSESDEKN